MIHIQEPQGILQNQVHQVVVLKVVVREGVQWEFAAWEKLELEWEVLEMEMQGV